VEFLFPALGSALPWLPPLRPGVHFWRAFSFRGLLRSAHPSATWEFHVGPRSSAVALSFGLNGDGYSDAVVSQRIFGTGERRLLVWLGGASGLSATVGQTLQADAPASNFTRSLSGGGDLNGDGHSDVAATLVTGEVRIYLGGPSGYSLPAAATVAVLPEASDAPWSVSITHDFDRDGHADLYSRGRVFYGAGTGLSGAPPLRLTTP
jgi:FG-GAP-like repeat